MAIKRYSAIKDTTITNAYQENLTIRGSGSNMGRADSLEIFSIYAQESTGSTELSRVLIEFPTDHIYSDRVASNIPASGSVKFFLKMYNAVTPFTVPRDFVLNIAGISKEWQEGSGMDMDNYTDLTRDKIGANWITARSSSSGVSSWSTVGGDYYTDASSSFTANFSKGTEDLEVDVTTLVEQWLTSEGDSGNLGEKKNRGFGVHLSSSYEGYFSSSSGANTGSVLHNLDGAKRSYYTKKFFARSSEFFYKRPVLEARWDSATKDDRGNFFYSSSLATGEENLNTIYLYNYFRGQLRNIPGVGTSAVHVSIFSGSSKNTAPSTEVLTLVADGAHVRSDIPTVITGGHVSTGVYSASFALTSSTPPLTDLFDVWFLGGDSVTNALDASVQYHTGTISPNVISLGLAAPSTTYVSNISNLKPIYNTSEISRFRVYTRQKNWSPSIYTKAVSSIPPLIIESGSYSVVRVIDDLQVIPFGTGSQLHTQMSFDVSGSYFDLDMGMLEPGYAYKVKLAFYNGSIGGWQEQPQEFKFRVEEE
tara:strand:+ start:10362 stop:11966 length:1605 start_codon:yes stop_codon:yes gene_type:complete